MSLAPEGTSILMSACGKDRSGDCSSFASDFLFSRIALKEISSLRSKSGWRRMLCTRLLISSLDFDGLPVFCQFSRRSTVLLEGLLAPGLSSLGMMVER